MLHSRLLNIFYPSMFKLYVCVSVISVCIDTCKYANRSNLFYNIFLSVLPCLPTCFSFPCYYTYMYLNRNTPVAVGSDSSGAQYVGSTVYQMTRPKCPSLGQDIYIPSVALVVFMFLYFVLLYQRMRMNVCSSSAFLAPSEMSKGCTL